MHRSLPFTIFRWLEYQSVICVITPLKTLPSVKLNKATGSNNIPASVLRNQANVLVPPLTRIFNKSLRETVKIPYGMTNGHCNTVAKTNLPVSI